MPFSLLTKNQGELLLKPWKILIVDDEEDIHTVTKMALKRFELEDRGVEFLSAFNSKEAMNLIESNEDIALIFLDVVMETDDAGLRVAQWLREVNKNTFTRIILRTGQPGQAPEEEVIMNYDINDYKQKTELDRTKLFTTVVTALRAYRDLIKIDKSRTYERAYRLGLQQVIESTTDLLEKKTLKHFFNGLLQQVVSLIHVDQKGALIKPVDGAGTICLADDYQIIAECGNISLENGLETKAIELLDKARKRRSSVYEGEHYVAYFPSNSDQESLLYLKGNQIETLTDVNIQLLNLFSNSIGIAFDNLLLNEEIIKTQEDLINRLGNAVESRSKEAGNHIKRMSEFCFILAKELNLPDSDCEILRQATPMHDVGKISTPDSVLLKAGKLTDQEMGIMKQHAEMGFEILAGSERPILKAAAIIAQQHHEKYDGTGYPSGLKGDEIHIFARILAVADVFDALIHKRCYKEPWLLEDILKLFKNETNKHFDPEVIAAFMKRLDEIIQINNELTNSDCL
jgi:response regulator RpfG family c-di-GMP phosphodiesterase